MIIAKNLLTIILIVLNYIVYNVYYTRNGAINNDDYSAKNV